MTENRRIINDQNFKILHLEDNPADAELVARELKRGKIRFEQLVVEDKEGFEKALKEFKPDIILSDHSLPSFNSIQALRIVSEAGINVPFILITATISEEFAVEVMHLGAHDYILKDRLQRLPSAVVNAMEKYYSAQEREKYFKEVISNEAMLNEAEKLAHFGSFKIDLINNSVKWSHEMHGILDYKIGEALPSLENFFKRVHPEDLKAVQLSLENPIVSSQPVQINFRILKDDGAEKFIHSKLLVKGDEHGRAIQITGFNQDLTELKISEDKKRIAEDNLLMISSQMSEYKLMALRSVMNPHFLFNCLNSIQYFIAKNERKFALDYLSIFSILIRKILDSSINHKVTLTGELEILKLYMELEVLRFDNKFDFEIIIDDQIDTDNIEIPSLLIQPYVENAILHGLNNKKDEKGRLKIHLMQDKDYIIFTVEDNGVGREMANIIKQKNGIKEKSYGMLVTKERLEIINKNNDVSVTITDMKDMLQNPIGTSVKIFIKIT